jgi:predicted Ser/Thr protein kinase
MKTLEPGSYIEGRYRIQQLIGRGGMGVVYSATDERMRRRVAIKTIGPEMTDELIARFEDEALAAGMLKSPYVVTIYEFGNDNGMPFIVMELLEGRDLQQLLAAAGTMDVRRAVNIVLDVCRAIGAAHAFQIAHRDLTCRNVFVTKDGTTKVLDFGTSRLPGTPRRTEQDTLCATWQYVAPERLKGEEGGALGDVYSIGVVLYELVTGSVPFINITRREPLDDKALQLAIVAGSYVDPLELRGDLPLELVAVIRHAMERLPAERFASVHLLGRALLAYAGEKGLALHREYFEGDEPMVQRVEALTGPVTTVHRLVRQRLEAVTVPGEFQAVEEFRRSRALEAEATAHAWYIERPGAGSPPTPVASESLKTPESSPVKPTGFARRAVISLAIAGAVAGGAWRLGAAKLRRDQAAAARSAEVASPTTMFRVATGIEHTDTNKPAEEERQQLSPPSYEKPVDHPSAQLNEAPPAAPPKEKSTDEVQPPKQPSAADERSKRSRARKGSSPKPSKPETAKSPKRAPDDKSDIILDPPSK